MKGHKSGKCDRVGNENVIVRISKIFIIWILEKDEEKWDKSNVYQDKDY